MLHAISADTSASQWATLGSQHPFHGKLAALGQDGSLELCEIEPNWDIAGPVATRVVRRADRGRFWSRLCVHSVADTQATDCDAGEMTLFAATTARTVPRAISPWDTDVSLDADLQWEVFLALWPSLDTGGVCELDNDEVPLTTAFVRFCQSGSSLPFLLVGTGPRSESCSSGGRLVVFSHGPLFRHSHSHFDSMTDFTAPLSNGDGAPEEGVVRPCAQWVAGGPVHSVAAFAAAGPDVLAIAAQQRLFVQEAHPESNFPRLFVDVDHTVLAAAAIKNYFIVADFMRGVQFIMFRADEMNQTLVRLARSGVDEVAKPTLVGTLILGQFLGLVAADFDGLISVYAFTADAEKRDILKAVYKRHIGSRMSALLPLPLEEGGVGLFATGVDGSLNYLLPAEDTPLPRKLRAAAEQIVPQPMGGLANAPWSAGAGGVPGPDAQVFRDLLFLPEPVYRAVLDATDS
eukprot:Polyplicarium_translucidae@DN1640_c0_g1_i1.p1